jgi:hypothetical protein
MTDVPTGMMQLSLQSETIEMLRAMASASNGSIHNCADSAIRRGLAELVAERPPAFSVRFRAALRALEEGK